MKKHDTPAIIGKTHAGLKPLRVETEKVVLHASAAIAQKGIITDANITLPETQRFRSIAIKPASKILRIQNLLM